MNFPRAARYKILVLAIVSALVFFILFKTSVHGPTFLGVLRTIDLRFFWLAFALVPLLFLCNGVRWYFVLRAAGFFVPLFQVIKVVLGSTSFSVIPGRIGDFARSYPLRRYIPVPEAIGTIILEKIMDVFVLLGYAAVGFFTLGYVRVALLIFCFFVAVPVLLTLVATFQKQTISSHKLVQKIYDALGILKRVQSHKLFLLLALLSSVFNWSLAILQFYWLMTAVHAATPFIAAMAFVPLSIFVGLIPITLAGAGTRDAAFVFFLQRYASSGQSLSASVLYGLQGYWIPALVCLPLLYFFFKRPKEENGETLPGQTT